MVQLVAAMPVEPLLALIVPLLVNEVGVIVKAVDELLVNVAELMSVMAPPAPFAEARSDCQPRRGLHRHRAGERHGSGLAGHLLTPAAAAGTLVDDGGARE